MESESSQRRSQCRVRGATSYAGVSSSHGTFSWVTCMERDWLIEQGAAAELPSELEEWLQLQCSRESSRCA